MALDPARRALWAVLGAGAVAASALLGAPAATADPPDCTAADMAGVAAGVSAATSAYLFTHPDVNDFVTNLQGQPRDQVLNDVQDYLDARPQTKAEIRAIRAPLANLRARCGISGDAAGNDLPMAR